MFNTLFRQYSIQGFPGADMKEYIEEKVVTMYKGIYGHYFRDMVDIPAENLIEVPYSDFVKDPVTWLEKCYKHLNINGFEKAKPFFEEHVQGQKNYKVNKLEMDQELRDRINRELKFFFERYNIPMEA